MALKRLTAAEMLNVSERWVRRGSPERARLEETPETAPLLPRIERARRAPRRR